MTNHTLEVGFVSNIGAVVGVARPTVFKNFAVTPEGHLVIKNFHPDFRNRLQDLLLDESQPFSPILPVSGSIAPTMRF